MRYAPLVEGFDLYIGKCSELQFRQVSQCLIYGKGLEQVKPWNANLMP